MEPRHVTMMAAAVALLGMLTACGSPSPTASSPAAASPSASSPRPTTRPLPDNLCNALDVQTVDSVLGVMANAPIWDGQACTWASINPHGGLTLDRIPQTQAAQAITAGQAAGATKIPGLGIAAIGSAQSGMPAPAPPTQAFVIIDLGTTGLSVHISGPAVTLDDAVKIAHDVVG